MRPLVLLAALLGAAALGGCSLSDCDLPPPTRQTAAGQTLRVASAPAVDTLVVAYAAYQGDPVFVLAPGTPAVAASGSDALELTYDVAALGAPALPLQSAVRGDTVFVQLEAPVVRRACSPALAEVVATLTRVALPDGARAVRVVGLPAGYRLPDVDGPPRRPTLTHA